MNEDAMTLDQIIAFHTLMCEAQKIIDSWDAEDDADQLGDDFEKHDLCKRYRGLDLYKISKHRRSCKWSHREEELYGFISFPLPELQGWRISWN